MKRIIKIAAMAFFAAVLGLSSAFADDPVPLDCSVSAPNPFDFGTHEVFNRGSFVAIADATIQCNRTPKDKIDVWISLGSYSSGGETSRNMKRSSPSSEHYIGYILQNNEWKYFYDYGGQSVPVMPYCFTDGKCILKIYGTFSFSDYNFYAGHYSDPNVTIKIRYSSEY